MFGLGAYVGLAIVVNRPQESQVVQSRDLAQPGRTACGKPWRNQEIWAGTPCAHAADALPPSREASQPHDGIDRLAQLQQAGLYRIRRLTCRDCKDRTEAA